MTRSELIEKLVQKNPHLLVRDVERLVDVVFQEILGTLSRGQRIEMRGFGVFSLRERAPRVGRNPRTGVKVQVPEKRVIHFKTGKKLHQKLNP